MSTAKRQKNTRKNPLLAVGFWLIVLQLPAQDLKKSTVIETIEGKKYYMHTVEKGQTLYAIAHAYELKVNDLVMENPDAIDGIKPGQILKIPFLIIKPKAEVLTRMDSSRYHFHQVLQGETVYSLSKAFSVSAAVLSDLNPEIKDGLKIGQTIKLPAGQADPHPEMVVEKKPVPKSDSVLKKKNFSIALFLPFHSAESADLDVDKLVSGEQELSGKSEIAVQFYQGVQMAVDSLKKNGVAVKIFAYDIDEGDSARFQALLKNPELLKMDLMIGPLYSSNFVPLSKFAKENRIFITSPLSQQNKLLFNNPFVSKVSASVITQSEQTADYMAMKCKSDNLIIVNSGSAKDASLIKALKTRLNAALKEIRI